MSATSKNFTYTLRHLGPRDEIVFRSVIRVLHGKTRHSWLYLDHGTADLVLMGDQPADAASPSAVLTGQAVIHVNSAGGHDLNALSWPIRTADLVTHMDLAGDQLARRCEESTAALSGAAPACAPQPAAPASRPLSAEQCMGLLRWPDAVLLQRDARFIKLATLLTGRPVKMAELMERSNCPLEVCQQFVEVLDSAGLLRMTHTPEAAALPAFKPAALTQQPARSESHGLLARIRLRLEMIVRAPAGRHVSS